MINIPKIISRSTRIAATALLPLLATSCSGFPLLLPPTTTTSRGFASISSTPNFSTPCWIRVQGFSTMMPLSATDSNNNNNDNNQEQEKPATEDGKSPSLSEEKPPLPPKKLHSVTVCMVPPPENNDYVWEQVMEMRRILKDPGYYRWPPHANLMYPFLELGNTVKNPEFRKANLQDIVTTLQMAMSQCSPFRIQLRQFGTFGGKQRGVLWLDPESFPLEDCGETNEESLKVPPPLVQLQSKLEEAFPACKAQSQKSNNGFTPHMTLSHFESLEAAMEAQELIAIPTDPPLEFTLDRIYLLERIGDDGQFLRVAEIGLGGGEAINKEESILDPPAPFPGMPTTEEDWVHEERMKLKSRRNNKGGRGKRKQQRRTKSWTPRVPDTPEVIAAKRAERKAKRERLEREEQQQQQQQLAAKKGETPSQD